MKRLFLFLLCLVLFGSCLLLPDNSSTTSLFRHLFENDSNEYLFILLDFDPSPTTISNNNIQRTVWPHDYFGVPSKNFLPLKSPEDSVFIYVAFMDSLLLFFDSQHDYHLDPDDIKDEALIARLTYIYKDLFDDDNKESEAITVHFPPLNDSDSRIVYYNGFTSRDFK